MSEMLPFIAIFIGIGIVYGIDQVNKNLTTIIGLLKHYGDRRFD